MILVVVYQMMEALERRSTFVGLRIIGTVSLYWKTPNCPRLPRVSMVADPYLSRVSARQALST